MPSGKLLPLKAQWINLIIFTLTLQCIACVWVKHPDIKTDTISFLLVSEPIYSNTSTMRTLNLPFRGTLTGGPRGTGIGINGLQAYITYDFSSIFDINSVTDTELVVSWRVLGDSLFTRIGINYIVVGPTTNFMQVWNQCVLCNSIDHGNGTRSEYLTRQTSLQHLTSLKVLAFISGFELHNDNGINNDLFSQSSINDGFSTINYKFTTSENNTIKVLCFTTIVYDQIQTQQDHYYVYGQTNNAIMKNISTSFTIGTPLMYQGVDQMFFGMTKFNFSRGTTRLFYVHTENVVHAQTGYQTNYGAYEIVLSWFYFVERSCSTSWWDTQNLICIVAPGICPLNTYYSSLGIYCAKCHYTCDKCDSPLINHCINCNSAHYRQITNDNRCICSVGYISTGVQECQSCAQYVPGCATCISPQTCSACLPSFTRNGVGTCDCNYGFLVSGICILQAGCISAVNYNGNVGCLACNQTLKYMITNSYTCDCLFGFYEVGYRCIGKCGDGIIVEGEDCDDGNVMEGDGCNSVCNIQGGWVCSVITNTTKSKCKRISNHTISVRYILRNVYTNQMIISLGVSPTFPSQYTRMKWKPYITHNVPCTPTDRNFSAQYNGNNQLILVFNYSENLEKKYYQISVALDEDYFTPWTSQIPMFARGMNAKLSYDDDTSSAYAQSSSSNAQSVYPLSTNYYLQISVTVLSIISLCVAFFSLFISQRLIGIETIQIIQLVLFSLPFLGINGNSAPPCYLSPLEKLRYANGYNFITGWDAYRVYEGSDLYADFGTSWVVGVEKEFLLSCNLMLILIAVVGIIVLFLSGLLRRYISMFGLVDEKDTLEAKKSLQFDLKIDKQFDKQSREVKKSSLMQLEVSKNQPVRHHCTLGGQQFEIYRSRYLLCKWLLDFSFQRLFFTLCLVPMYHIVFSTSIRLSNMSSPYYLIPPSLDILVCISSSLLLIFFLALIALNGIFPRTEFFNFTLLNSPISKLYPCYYFTYQTILITSLVCFRTQIWGLYTLLGLTIINLIILVIMRPYVQVVHNVGIIGNQIVVGGVLGAWVYIVTFQEEVRLNQIICCIIVGLLYLVVVWGIVRIWRGWIQSRNKMEQKIENQDGYDKTHQKILQMIRPLDKNGQKQPLVFVEDIQKNNGKYMNTDLDWTYNKMAQNHIKSRLKTSRMLLDKDQVSQRDQNSEDSECPYDEFGYIKQNFNMNQEQQVQEKPQLSQRTKEELLRCIKDKLRKDLNRKINLGIKANKNNQQI